MLARLKETTQAKKIIEGWGNPPLVSLEGIRQWVTLAQKGDCLTPFQLEEIEISLVAVMRLKAYLNKCKQQEIPLAYYDENLDCLEKADSVMRANKDCMSDSFSTFRNGHLCVPVKKEYKFRINGSVIDKSSTGNTLFIEPSSVARFCEELQLLQIDIENEERRILYCLTGLVADQAEIMEQNIKMMEKLDFIFSKGKLSLEYSGTEPNINTERRIVIKEGRHPLIDKKICVPLTLEIGNRIQGLIITGPNTGGKTVAIKTVALNCMMAQCGLHVACREAELCMNSNYLCDIGDGQNLSENLSTFSAHITNVLDILERVNQDSLVIMDELGSGTDPTEGMGIAIAILEELKKSKAMFLVTTHYPEVKVYAQKQDTMLNARMTFDKESLQPLYQLVPGEAGESCALYIARKMGMPDEMLLTALKAAYGDELLEGMEFSGQGTKLTKRKTVGIQKKKTGVKRQEIAEKFQLGDSVFVYPDKKIGIVCQMANEKGVLRVQLADKKIWINHKRLKLKVAAEELYPEDYDFSILFDSVENRKIRHDMKRKYVEGKEIVLD